MKKTKKLLFVLLVLLVALCVLTVAACTPPADPEEENNSSETDDGTLNGKLAVRNGTFYSATNSDNTNSWLKDNVTGWTKNSGATSYSSSTVDVKMGVVDLAQQTFDSNKGLFSAALQYPGLSPHTQKSADGTPDDTNALVVALPDTQGSLYYRLSSALTLTKGKYYKLSVDVWTQLFLDQNDANEAYKGAYLYVTTGAYAEFTAVNTAGEWKTYDVYIEGNNYEDRTVYIELWLGHGPQYLGTSSSENTNPRLTKGVAFFDNVLLTELERADFKAAETVVGAEGEGVYNDNPCQVRSMVFADPNFIYESKYTSTSSVSSTTRSYYSTRSGSPNNYALTVGKEDVEDTTDFPSYTGSSATTGIFDISKFYTESTTESEGVTTTTYADKFHDAVTSSFHAPDHDAFYAADNQAHLNTLKETEALLIYHPNYTVSGAGYKSSKALLIERDRYYRITVWVYVWVPEYGVDEPAAVEDPLLDEQYNTWYTQAEHGRKTIDQLVEEGLLTDPYAEGSEASDAEKTAFDDLKKKRSDYLNFLTSHDSWQSDKDEYEAARERARNDGGNTAMGARFKLTGTSVENDNLIRSSTGLDCWQPLTFHVKGNELTGRQVFLEFWYGEGNWGEDTLLPGGAIFDNVLIEVSDDPLDGEDYVEISQMTDDEKNLFHLLGTERTDDFTEISRTEGKTDPDLDPKPDWEYRYEDDKASTENAIAGILSGAAAADQTRFDAIPELAGLTMPSTQWATPAGGAEKAPFDVVTLYNKKYGAVTLKSNIELTIGTNSFYRLSLWVNTQGVDSDKGLSVALLNADDDSSLSTFSTINTEGDSEGPWKEYSFFLRGSATKTVKAYLKFTLGTGDVFTPDSHVKGAAFITAITYKDIEYKEFNSASTSSTVNTYTVSSSSATNSVTNGQFLNLDTSNYDNKDDVIFEGGDLVGFAKPASWTSTDATGALERPTSVRITSTYSLTWQAVTGADRYYIYMDGVKVDDGAGGTKTENDVFVDWVNALGEGETSNTSYQVAFRKSGNLKVRAVRFLKADGSHEDGGDVLWEACIAEGRYVLSPFSTTVANTNNDSAYPDAIPAAPDGHTDIDPETKMGIIDYKSVSEDNATLLGLDKANVYPAVVSDPPLDGFAFRSPNNNLLALHSNYYTRMGYVMSSTQSLSSNGWYELGVWVRTLGGAKASVTIANSSNIFARTTYAGEDYAVDGDFIGYVNIDTQGAWEYFAFYLRTTVNTASVKLELFLGNKYAVDPEDKVKGGMSKGTVLFDDVYYKSLGSEEAYNQKLYGTEEPTDEDVAALAENTPASLYDPDEGSYFNNLYRFKLLDYTVDSFDVTTSVTADGQGQKPGDYTHYVANDGTDYSDDDDQKAQLYGVLDQRNLKPETLEMLVNSGLNDGNWMGEYQGDGLQEALSNFLKTDWGNNFLMMANLQANGQYYLSSTSLTFNSDTYYRIRFRAKAWLEDGKYAEFRLEYGESALQNQVIRIPSDETAWHEYTLYVYNERTSSLSSNHLSFYLGKNDARKEDGTPEDFFRGILLLDQVSVEKLADSEAYDAAKTTYDALSEDGKAAAAVRVHKVDKEESTDNSGGEEEETQPERTVNAQVWLLVASIVIAVILIVVVVVLTWRRIKKHIKRKPPKVRSVMPVNQQEAGAPEAPTGGKKSDLGALVDEDPMDVEVPPTPLTPAPKAPAKASASAKGSAKKQYKQKHKEKVAGRAAAPEAPAPEAAETPAPEAPEAPTSESGDKQE